MHARFLRAIRSPLAWTLSGVLTLFVVGLGWGLPASDPWDNDGVAPRDFLVGVAQTFAKDGFDFAYLHLAPLHLVLLAALTLPTSLTALRAAGGTDPETLIHTFIQPRYMTPIAWIARAVSVAMAIGVVLALARVAEELRAGRRAGALVAAACGTNMTLVYYAHTTNLEVPYLFWGGFALLALVRAIARREPRRLRTFAILGALAIGSKDQAAGLFLLGAPCSLVLWIATDAWARQRWRAIAGEAAVALGLAIAVFLVVDEVVVNPAGFVARVRFLLGPASQDWTEYSRDLRGRLVLLWDIGAHLPVAYPALVGLLGVAGVAVAARGPRETRAARLAPLACAASFTVCVNLTTYRTEARFILPQTLILGLYAGIALDALLGLARGPASKRLALALAVTVLSWTTLRAINMDAVLLGDPRYDAEAWMNAHFAPGDSLEIYGRNVYLPRFPERARVERVDPEEPVAHRSPLPGVIETQDTWDDLPNRHPKWISVSNAWAWRFLSDPPNDLPEGRAVAKARTLGVDAVTCRYFRALLAGELGYRVAHTSAWSSRFWPAVHIHASTSETVWILERVD
jgi:hypothetical protein